MLGSRSPRRLELLQQIVPAEAIEVLPPSSSVEAGFEGLADWPAVEGRLLEIARGKCADVLDQLSARRADPRRIVITADTIVVVRGNGGRLVVLGQPPEDASWPEVVRRWFLDYYAGKRTKWRRPSAWPKRGCRQSSGSSAPLSRFTTM